MVSAHPQGATEEFEAQLRPLLGPAYRTAYRLSGNRADAEDLVQEAALLAWRGYRSFDGSNFRGWFFRILMNAFYSGYRKHRRQGKSVDLEEVPELYLWSRTVDAGLHDGVEDPAATLLARLDAERINAAIAALPEEYRAVAALYFLEDATYQEIAEMLNVPIGTVRSRLHRARRLLQRALWAAAVEQGLVPGAGGPKDSGD